MKRFGTFTVLSFILFTLCIAVGVGPAAASSLVIEPSGEVSLGAGESVEVSLGVDALPEGLSGYILTVEVEDPAVAEITAVSFPAWASMKDNSVLPASSVRITAADLNCKVEAGASDVPLATLTLKGTGGGSARISVTVGRMDSDTENTIFLDGAKNPSSAEENEEDEEPERVKPQPSGSLENSVPSETPETEEVGAPAEAEGTAMKKSEPAYVPENSVPSETPEETQAGNEAEESGNALPGFGLVGTISTLLGFSFFRKLKN